MVNLKTPTSVNDTPVTTLAVVYYFPVKGWHVDLCANKQEQTDQLALRRQAYGLTAWPVTLYGDGHGNDEGDMPESERS